MAFGRRANLRVFWGPKAPGPFQRASSELSKKKYEKIGTTTTHFRDIHIASIFFVGQQQINKMFVCQKKSHSWGEELKSFSGKWAPKGSGTVPCSRCQQFSGAFAVQFRLGTNPTFNLHYLRLCSSCESGGNQTQISRPNIERRF